MFQRCLFAITALSLITSSKFAEAGESVKTTRGSDRPSQQAMKSPLERPLNEVLAETTLRSAIDRHLLKALLKGKSPGRAPYRCDDYIKDDGNFGKVGEIAKQVLENEKFKTMLTAFKQSDIARLCPNFPKMTPSQRTGFWIWTMAGIEWDETSCGTLRMSVPSRGRPGTQLVGRLHLPNSKQDRELLGAMCVNSQTDEGQIRCAYHLILQGLNRTDGNALLDRKAYYEIQRPGHPLHEAFRSYLAAYPVCGIP